MTEPTHDYYDDPFDDPDAQAWAAHVRTEMLPQLAASAASMTLYSGDFDVKLAVEVGASILLDKPLIVIAQPGVKVPEHLVRAADKIIEADMSDPVTTTVKIQAVLREMGLG